MATPRSYTRPVSVTESTNQVARVTHVYGASTEREAQEGSDVRQLNHCIPVLDTQVKGETTFTRNPRSLITQNSVRAADMDEQGGTKELHSRGGSSRSSIIAISQPSL
jgi:hypothetical protein